MLKRGVVDGLRDGKMDRYQETGAEGYLFFWKNKKIDFSKWKSDSNEFL